MKKAGSKPCLTAEENSDLLLLRRRTLHLLAVDGDFVARLLALAGLCERVSLFLLGKCDGSNGYDREKRSNQCGQQLGHDRSSWWLNRRPRMTVSLVNADRGKPLTLL